MKILHIINSLDIGGAEKMLVKLARSDVFASDEILIVTLLDKGALAPEMEKAGYRVISLGLSKNLTGLMRGFKLISVIREFKPDIIQSWLYQSDLMAGFFACICRIPVIWSLRQSNLSAAHNKPATRLCIKACAVLSRYIPHAIISNSAEAARVHHKAGYCRNKICVIPNGFDTDIFSPNKEYRKEMRTHLGLSQSTPVIGMVARYDSQKNHIGFLRAASAILTQVPQAQFVLVGEGVSWENKFLTSEISRTETLRQHIHLLGARQDIPQIMSGFDVLALPSAGESFPNVVGEAMASGVPCVVTDVGDCAEIVGDTGSVAEEGDMAGFAKALIQMLTLPAEQRHDLGQAARKRIVSHYSIARTASRFRDIYLSHISDRQG